MRYPGTIGSPGFLLYIYERYLCKDLSAFAFWLTGMKMVSACSLPPLRGALRDACTFYLIFDLYDSTSPQSPLATAPRTSGGL